VPFAGKFSYPSGGSGFGTCSTAPLKRRSVGQHAHETRTVHVIFRLVGLLLGSAAVIAGVAASIDGIRAHSAYSAGIGVFAICMGLLLVRAARPRQDRHVTR
jgi:uncharacterized membrane protein HdeD (DUF308 family)